jgi:hypothetical protein
VEADGDGTHPLSEMMNECDLLADDGGRDGSTCAPSGKQNVGTVSRTSGGTTCDGAPSRPLTAAAGLCRLNG